MQVALNAEDRLLVAPQSMTNTATVTANLDTRGAAYATLRIAFASEINTNAVGPTISLLTSDDTEVTNFATVVADRTSEAFVTAKALIYHVDMKGLKRYLRLSVTTATATNDNVTLGVISTLTRRGDLPASTSDMVATTADNVVIV